MAQKYEDVEEATTQSVGQYKVADFLERVIVIPLSKTPGKVYLKDGSGDEFVVYPGIGNLLAINDLRPAVITFGMQSNNGGWRVRTEANVKAIVIGDF